MIFMSSGSIISPVSCIQFYARKPYIGQHVGNNSLCCNKIWFSCFNLWICGDGQSINVYAPYWLEGQWVILEQEVCWTTPFKNDSHLKCRCSQTPNKRLWRLKSVFCGTPSIYILVNTCNHKYLCKNYIIHVYCRFNY